MKQKPKTCAHCGEEFTPERRNGIYCSQTCRQYSYLSRKTGEVYGLPKKENGSVDFSNVPALIIEEEEKKESISVNKTQTCGQSFPVNYQLQCQKESTKNVNWNNSVDVKTINQSSQKNQLMNPETNMQTNNDEQNTSVIILDHPDVCFESKNNNNEEHDEFVPQKTYDDHLIDEKCRANRDLNFWYEFEKPKTPIKSYVVSFGNRIKPFLKSLLMMDGKQVPIKSLKTWGIEADRVVLRFFPDHTCPIFYPPVGFFTNDFQINIDEFVKSIEPLCLTSARIQLSDQTKAKAEVTLKIIESFTDDTPNSWELP